MSSDKEEAFKLPPFTAKAHKFWLNDARQCFIMAIIALKANKMRTFLTMLGIIIGVGAVIALVSVGMGVKEQCDQFYFQPGFQ